MSPAKAQSFVSDLLEGALQLIYPPFCLLCGIIGAEVLCENCLASLITPVPMPYCLRCGQVQITNYCSKCSDFPPGFVRCRAVGIHRGDLADLIHKLKYRDKPMVAVPLAKIMADFLLVRGEIFENLKFDAIVPVPLHKHRLRTRGYNQSARLSIGISQSLGIPIDEKVLVRLRDTSQQVGMLRSGRVQNLKSAFQANPSRCTGKTFLIVDDVTTTGSTMIECATALLDAGASKIYGIAMALG